MSIEKDVGELVGKIEYLRQDQRIYQETMCRKIDRSIEKTEKKVDAVLLIAGDVERNTNSITNLWRTIWSFFVLSLGGNIFGAWWAKK